MVELLEAWAIRFTLGMLLMGRVVAGKAGVK